MSNRDFPSYIAPEDAGQVMLAAGVRLTLKLPNSTDDRNARLHCLQLIPPLQPTVGIDGNLQQIDHLPSPELKRWEEVQSENALQHLDLEADGQWQPLLM